MIDVIEAIHGRQSVRAFDRDQPVTRAQIERILEAGARAPNGSNLQPWHVYVLMGDARDTFADDITDAYMSDAEDARDYAYYMSEWRDPYLTRRRQTGWGLYQTVGIQKGDFEATKAQQGRNYRFFDAPVGLMITMDADMGQGAWLDMGAFIQTILLAARGEGLEACPQAAFCNYPNRIRALLGIAPTETLVTGLAIGYPDRKAVVNTFRTPRRPVSEFATFLDTLAPQATVVAAE
ncbi:MAG: nitroreductase [Pseudomonadota bacterium]